jgi:hypothetical protein
MIQCEQCKKEFKNQWGLKVHIARTHERKKHEEAKAATAHAEPPKPKRQSVVVQYCPCCGINIAAVSMAVNYVRK